MLISANPRALVEAIRQAVIREFDGGWNSVDNDLNLSTSYSKLADNVFRGADGSIKVRWGTQLFWGSKTAVAFLAEQTGFNFVTTISSAVITITVTSHGMLSGHRITIAGQTSTVDGIPAGELNGTHTITWVNANSFTFTVSTTATAGGSFAADGPTTLNQASQYTYRNIDTTGASGDIIAVEYYADHLIVVDQNGDIVKIDASGKSVCIWSDYIAAKLTGAPSGWGSTTFASMAEFDRKLLICNGIDKPLVVDLYATITATNGYCSYILDPSSGANTNTPVCRYVKALNNYVVFAGDLADPDALYISSTGTYSVWPGDAAPNDSTTIQAGRYVSSGGGDVRSISRFDDRLVIGCDSAVLFATLGDTNGTTHSVDISESIDAHGSVAHAAATSLGDDLLVVDYAGVPSVARALFTGSFRAERASELIAPDIQADIAALSLAAIEDRVHAVFNRADNQYMLFIPNHSSTPTETKCYAYTLPILGRKRGSWSRFRGWNFRASCRTQLDRIMLAKEDRIFVYGTESDPTYADYINSAPDLVDGTDAAIGEPIDFDWELPWADFDQRMRLKALRYIQIDTRGTAAFTMSIYIDNIFNRNDNTTIYASLDFVGGDTGGYGDDYGESLYGGGRRTADERLWDMRARFKIMKLRFTGAAIGKLNFIAIGLNFLRGSIRR